MVSHFFFFWFYLFLFRLRTIVWHFSSCVFGCHFVFVVLVVVVVVVGLSRW